MGQGELDGVVQGQHRGGRLRGQPCGGAQGHHGGQQEAGRGEGEAHGRLRGIPPERLAIVFEKFSGDPKRGTGLGLAIVKHVIDVHGGRVWVESKQEQGSRFVFVLPR